MHEIIDYYDQVNKFGKSNGLKLKVIKEGQIEYEMELKEEHEALPNYTHGGTIAGMMDGVLGVAALSSSCENEQLVATLEFKINFINSAQTGRTIIGVGTVEKAGKNIIFANGEIRDKESSKLIATASGTFKTRPFPEKV